MNNIDIEWEQFLENNEEYESNYDINNNTCLDNNYTSVTNNTDYDVDNNDIRSKSIIPKATPIYISTKTKIAFLNQEIDLQKIFWLLPVIEYHIPNEGIIKKQMKINSTSQEEINIIDERLKTEYYVDQYIINHIDNPVGRIKFKDVRKVSVGLSKKDVLSYRCKKKSAFYNCFVVILRILWKDKYKEIHVKVFNTGKLEIPGIQNDDILSNVLEFLVKIINMVNNNNIGYIANKNETVLVNSNFNCGFYIDREKLFNILRFKYRINSCYDPCSYPGIQCEFYYDNTLDKNDQTGMQPNNDTHDNTTQKLKIKQNNLDNKNITKISFMIFRTGSILIVGKCNDIILNNIYDFIKILLEREFNEIAIKSVDKVVNTNKTIKIRKKYITISTPI